MPRFLLFSPRFAAAPMRRRNMPCWPRWRRVPCAPVEGVFSVFLRNPFQERKPAFAALRVKMKESIQNAGGRVSHMQKPPRELTKRGLAAAAVDQDEQTGGKACAIGSGFAMNQRGLRHGAVNFRQSQNAIAMRCAAAFKRRIDVNHAELCRSGFGEEVGAALPAAIGTLSAQIDNRADAVASHQPRKARRRGMV